jgi:undecaprenyl-phosphate galactose phosphotransferase
MIREDVLDELGLKFMDLFSAWSIYYLLIIPFALIRFWYVGHYTRRKPFWDELRDVILTLFLLFVAEGAILFLAKSSFSRLWVASSFLLTLILLPVLRVLVKKILHSLGKWQIVTVVIGTGQNAIDAVSALQSEPLLGFSVQQVFSLNGQPPSGEHLQVNEYSIPVHCLGDDPIGSIRRFGEPNIVFALESGGIRDHLGLIEDLHRNFSDIYVVPALRGLPLYGMEINTFFRHEVLLLRVRNILFRRMPRLLKRTFDVAGALSLLGLLFPLLVFLAWRVHRDGGSVFYRHKRIGQDGREFGCLKFRSMIVGADKVLDDFIGNDTELRKQWDADHKLKNDPRITRVGKFLRSTSLDEVPQLWNVLRGDMSLVGPRPIVVDEMGRYGKGIHYYKSVRPGMTGLWQISGRNDTDYSNRVYLDAWYVKNWSLWSDVVILFKTINVVLNKQGAY